MYTSMIYNSQGVYYFATSGRWVEQFRPNIPPYAAIHQCGMSPHVGLAKSFRNQDSEEFGVGPLELYCPVCLTI